MNNKFSELGVSEPIVKAIEKLDFVTPTEVQKESIPKVLQGKDLIVMSKTGSGKTGAFGLPIIQSIDLKVHLPQALILTPTRELAVQVNHDIKEMSKYMDVQTTAVYGQHSIKSEIEAIKKGATIITGSPGRVLDHIKRKTLNTANIRFVVLDEADRMLDMGFIDQVVQIIKSLPKKRVTLLFSATMPPAIQRICKSYMYQPEVIEIDTDTKTVDTIKQVYYRVEPNEKRTQLNNLLKVNQPDSCMVFCNTRVEVDRVQAYLARKGYVAEALHGANNQNSRMRTIERFKKNAIQVLVATDVAARGIHIDELSLVINYDVPEDKDSYIHRVGRTGRAGNSGKAITLVTGNDIMSFYMIEEHVGVLISEEELPTDKYVKECVVAANGKWSKIKVQNGKVQNRKVQKSKVQNGKNQNQNTKTQHTKTQHTKEQKKDHKPKSPQSQPHNHNDHISKVNKHQPHINKTNKQEYVKNQPKSEIEMPKPEIIMTKYGPATYIGKKKKSLKERLMNFIKGGQH